MRGADGTEAISALELKQGWNLIAAPTTDSIYLKDALNNLKEGVDYDKIRECTDPKNNTFKKPLFLKKGKAYYIHCLKDTTWKIPAYADRTNFAYDGDGGRLNYIAKGDITTYLGSLYEEKLDGSTTKHIYFGSTRIASITTPAGQAVKTMYYHSDHLGSSNILTDSDGNAIRRTEYKPYGEVFNNWEADPDSDMPNFFFTGKRLDEETGLYYYGARYYDPKLGRFTQADTIVPSPANPQSFNRYSYTDNNPINYTDPTGHWSWKKFGHSVLAGFVGGVVTALTGGLAAPLALMWGGMAAGATMGAFEGGVKGALIGAGIGAFMGANIGAGIAMFGSGFGYAALGAAAIYTGATQGWEGLGYMGGGMIGGAVGFQLGTAITTNSSRIVLAREGKAGVYDAKSLADRRKVLEAYRDAVNEFNSLKTPEEKIARMEQFLQNYGPKNIQRALYRSDIFYNPNLEPPLTGKSYISPIPWVKAIIDIGPAGLETIDELGLTMIHEALHVDRGYLVKPLSEAAHDALEARTIKIWREEMFPQIDKF